MRLNFKYSDYLFIYNKQGILIYLYIFDRFLLFIKLFFTKLHSSNLIIFIVCCLHENKALLSEKPDALTNRGLMTREGTCHRPNFIESLVD